MKFLFITVFSFVLAIPVASQEPISFSYTNDSLPQVYQVGFRSVYPLGYNPSTTLRNGTKIDPHGGPANHFPWLHPGGTPDGADGTQFWSTKELKLPSPVVVRRATLESPDWYTPVSDQGYAWTYPVGTVATLKFFDKELGEFSHHVSTKVRAGNGIDCWEGEEIILTNRVPVWYNSPDNCTECHRDVGRHARILEPKRDNYYNWNRGSDGRFSWHPFNETPRSGNRHRVTIRDSRELIFK